MKSKLFPVLALIFSFVVTIARGQPIAWSGGGDQTSWNNPLNWVGGVVPVSTNEVVITSGSGVQVAISSAVTVRSLLCAKALTISAGSLTVTSDASTIQGPFTMTGVTTLIAIGTNTTLTVSGSANIDDENLQVYGGASMTFPTLTAYNKSCNGANWLATGSNSLLSLPALTNLTGQTCSFPSISAQAGGQILATNLANLAVAPLTVQADGTNSLIDFSGLTTASGGNGYALTFEASSGGTVRIPHYGGGTLVAFTLNPGGTMAPASIAQLTTITASGATVNFPALTNFDGGTLTANLGAQVTFPALNVLTGITLAVNSEASVNFSGLRNLIGQCGSGAWAVTGTGSVLSFPVLTNYAGLSCMGVAVQAQSGGQILATSLRSIANAPLMVQADGTNSLIDFTGLTSCTGQALPGITFEASAGGTVRIPNLAGGPFVGLSIGAGGSVPNALTNLVSLSVNGLTLTLPLVTGIDDGNITVSGGAVVTLPAVQNYNKACNGGNWLATGSNSVLNLPGLTNFMGQTCAFPSISAQAGGQILATNLAHIALAPLMVQADGTNSLIDFSGLTTAAGGNGYYLTFEASSGGTLRFPHFVGGPAVAIDLVPGGTLPTGNLAQLTTITASSVTANFPALTNFDGGIVTATLGAQVTLPVLSVVTGLTLTVNGGSSVNFSGLRNFIGSCSSGTWVVNGAGSVLSFPALTNYAGLTCMSFAVQAQAGGQILATSLRSILNAPLMVQADGTNSLIDFSGLTSCTGQTTPPISFEASAGGTVRLPNLAGGPVALSIGAGGSVPNALTNLASLSINGVTLTLPLMSNIDDGNITVSGGAVVSLPALQNYTKNCNGANWLITGSNSVLNLPGLTNLTGQTCNFPSISAQAGGQILATNLANISVGPLTVQADGTNSLIDFSGLTTASGGNSYALTFEASSGGTLRFPHFGGGTLVAIALNAGGTLPTANLGVLAGIIASGLTANFPVLTNFDGGSFNVSAGAQVTVPALTSFQGTNLNVTWQVAGAGSTLTLPGLTNLVGAISFNFPVQVTTGGKLQLANLLAIGGGNLELTVDGAGSLVDLSKLSQFFVSVRGQLNAQNGGAYLLDTQGLVLGNIAINVTPTNALLPPFLIGPTNLVLAGQAWQSYRVEYQAQTNGPWLLDALVPLTNSFEVIGQAQAPIPPFRSTEFTADPPLLDFVGAESNQLQIILFGASGKNFAIDTTTNLRRPIIWTSNTFAVMSNSFRFFPPGPSPDPVRFYRAREY